MQHAACSKHVKAWNTTCRRALYTKILRFACLPHVRNKCAVAHTNSPRQVKVRRPSVGKHLLCWGTPHSCLLKIEWQLLLSGHRHTTVESRVRLNPLALVHSHERSRRHRAVEMLSAVLHLLGRHIANGLVHLDQLEPLADILRPLPLLDWCLWHLVAPKCLAQCLRAFEALDINVAEKLGVLKHARAEEGIERSLVNLGIREIHHVLIKVVCMFDTAAACELFAERGVPFESDASDDNISREK